MAKLRLTLACWNYDRTRALFEDRVPIEGIDLTYLNLPVEETFFRMLRNKEFDVSEMSLSSYTMSLFAENPPFIAIPIFPSRFFRHSCIFINRNSGIAKPQDLVGKKVGTPEFQMTAGVWIRGILADQYSVPVSSTKYFTGGQEEAGRPEKIKMSLPPEINVESIPATKTLSQMLNTGEIDAIYSARTPSTFNRNSGNVGRLFDDFESAEREYYVQTKIFPIMHTVVIRRSIYEEHPWIAQSLTKAFIRSQRETYEDMLETAALKVMLPWLISSVESTKELMGEDFWPYGYEPNIHTLDTFLRYHHEQGLSKRRLKAKDLFAPESLESFKI